MSKPFQPPNYLQLILAAGLGLIAVGTYFVEPETMAFCTIDASLLTRASYDGSS